MNPFNDYINRVIGDNITKELNQVYTDSMLENIIYSFELSPSYYQVTKNNDLNTFYDVWILDKENAYKTDISEKKIIMKPGQTLNKGDYINWENNVWLCVKKDSQKTYYDDGLIQICNKALKYNYNGLIFEMPCIVSKIGRNAMTLENDQIIMSPNFYGIITIPYNTITKKIPLNARFLFDEFAYRVIGKDSITFTSGIVELKIQQDDIRNGLDDFINGYADQSNLKTDNYSINIANGNSIITIGNTLQINAQLLNNSSIISNPQLLYSSSDETIATINNTGLITSVGVGNCTITVTYANDSTIKSNINLTVESAVVANNYSINISGSSSIILNSQQTYTSTIMNNGNTDISKTVIWSITDSLGNSTMLATINSSTGTSCIIKANNSNLKGNVLLKATLSTDSLISNSINIVIKSAF